MTKGGTRMSRKMDRHHGVYTRHCLGHPWDAAAGGAAARPPADLAAKPHRRRAWQIEPRSARSCIIAVKQRPPARPPAMTDSKIPSDPPPEYSPAEHAAAGTGPRPGGPVRRPVQPLDIPIIRHLNAKRVVLASASPRRKALLQQVCNGGLMGLTNLEINPSDKPEDLDKSAYGPWEYVAETARRKCLDVYTKCLETQLASIPDPELVIAADTIIVTRDGRILEKPRSEAEHVKMLKYMRDTEMHRVLTAVTVLAPREDARHPGYSITSHTEETKVYFWGEENGLPDDVIEAYVRTREGVDKAGGYAVQGIAGMLLVEKIDGSVDNVVGLPVRRCLSMAEKVIFRQDEEGDEEQSGEEDLL
ncbi:acetylserotonin methytransferase-like protein (ASMTL) [Purpureocillium lilacinum]|uniref:Acetylserotonin methytransferase-like protein (ASMTL) n=2 Tax=Purpureocillium lilacinum TaxID=33203 RepID=A0A179GEM0_PURLI|nr:acetylserotonin methytransferase-like protein (ASMTL) [Purpureocillium lilacinum]